jgi:predicted enzyme related to lactoylglutathione lyase
MLAPANQDPYLEAGHPDGVMDSQPCDAHGGIVMPSSHNNFVWYDLMTTDTKAAEAFYSSVVGWRAQSAGMSDRSYTILSAKETPVAGLMPIPAEAGAAGARPMWNGYVGANDVDGFAARITAAGGTLHRGPVDIPDVGRFAVVADPDGASFMLFKGATGAPAEPAAPGTPGHIGWHELYAGNWEKAFAFYSGLFGWTKLDAMDMGPMGVYQIFATDSAPVGGIMTKPKEIPNPMWLYYFNVDDIDAAAARVKDNGGQVLNGPMEVPGGSWIVQGSDPQGATFAVVGPRR